ncbi:MAG TPA: serine/threonine-protein kinase [Polyangiaceae bacterium]|nr:serine/threonine-protein kinase [Polyangiaceae bacterium]
MSLSTGDIIDGKYRIVRLLGEGGMGAVYEGENMRIHRRVAIKVLHAGVAATGEAVARFEREAQAAGRIGSEHIVEVLDLGNLPSGDRYMVMEFMDGDSLSARIRSKGRLTPGEAYPILHQLLEALAAAHGAGIIHRDLKPDNVYLLKSRGGKADFVKLLDFGISKFNQMSGDSGFSMTRTGAVMGTPYYMAPEQAKGARDLDHRVDLYAAGVILYEGVTGEVPFNADTFNELLFKIVLEAARPVEQVVPGIDPNFAAIVNKSMAREPAARFQSAREFQLALEQWAAGAGPQLAASLGAGAPAPAPHAPMGTGAYAAAGTPPQGAMGTGQYPAANPNAAPAHTLGTGTPGNWANTGAYVPAEVAPKKSNTGLFVGLAAVGVLLLGGGAFVAMSLGHTKDDAAAAAAGKAEADKAADAEKAKAEAAEKAAQDIASKAAAEAEKAKAEAQAAMSEAEKAKAAAEAEKAKLAAAAAAPAPRGARPAPAPAKTEPKPAAAPAPAPAPAPAAAPASTGRRIRTSL